MKTKREEINPFAATVLLLSILAVTAFISVPGSMLEKMNYISKFKEQNGTAMFALLIVGILNSSLILGALLSYLNISRLGSKIQRFSKRNSTSENIYVNFSIGLLALGLSFLIVKMAWPYLPTFQLLPTREVRILAIFTTIVEALAVLGVAIFLGMCTSKLWAIMRKYLARAIPPYPRAKNTMVLGTINEI